MDSVKHSITFTGQPVGQARTIRRPLGDGPPTQGQWCVQKCLTTIRRKRSIVAVQNLGRGRPAVRGLGYSPPGDPSGQVLSIPSLAGWVMR